MYSALCTLFVKISLASLLVAAEPDYGLFTELPAGYSKFQSTGK